MSMHEIVVTIICCFRQPRPKLWLSSCAGDDRGSWKQYDACELVKQYKGPELPALIDVGTADSFLEVSLGLKGQWGFVLLLQKMPPPVVCSYCFHLWKV